MGKVIVIDLDPGDALVFRCDELTTPDDLERLGSSMRDLFGVNVVVVQGEFDMAKLSARRIGAMKELFNDAKFRDFMREIANRVGAAKPDPEPVISPARDFMREIAGRVGAAKANPEPVISPAVDAVMKHKPFHSVALCQVPMKIPGVMASKTCDREVDDNGDCPKHGHDVPVKFVKRKGGRYECGIVTGPDATCGRWLVADACPRHGKDVPVNYIMRGVHGE